MRGNVRTRGVVLAACAVCSASGERISDGFPTDGAHVCDCATVGLAPANFQKHKLAWRNAIARSCNLLHSEQIFDLTFAGSTTNGTILVSFDGLLTATVRLLEFRSSSDPQLRKSLGANMAAVDSDVSITSVSSESLSLMADVSVVLNLTLACAAPIRRPPSLPPPASLPPCLAPSLNPSLSALFAPILVDSTTALVPHQLPLSALYLSSLVSFLSFFVSSSWPFCFFPYSTLSNMPDGKLFFSTQSVVHIIDVAIELMASCCFDCIAGDAKLCHRCIHNVALAVYL